MVYNGLSSILPITNWGDWSKYPGALAWSPTTQAPAPLANGGLYSGPQSTGAWASKPFPATQYALAAEAAKVSQNPEVFYHQRIADNNGASYSPVVHIQPGPQYSSAVIPKAGAQLFSSPPIGMALQTFTYDANLPIPTNMSDNDPGHPKNVVRNAMIVQNQALADTKYDIYPPPRVEGFAVNETFSFYGSLVVIAILIFITLKFKNMPLRIVFMVIVVWLIHYVVAKLEKVTV